MTLNSCWKLSIFKMVFLFLHYITLDALDAYSNGWFQDAPVISAYNHLLNEYNSMFPCPLPPGSYFWSGAIGMCPCGTSLGHTVCVSTHTNISQIHHDYRAEPACLDQGKFSSQCLLQDSWSKMSANHPEFHKQAQSETYAAPHPTRNVLILVWF